MEEELDQAMADELVELEADIQEAWLEAAPLDYLRGFDSQVPADIFFENLISGTKDALLCLQSAVLQAENRLRKAWISELATLKKWKECLKHGQNIYSRK